MNSLLAIKILIFVLVINETLGQNCLFETNTRFFGSDLSIVSASTAFDCCNSCSIRQGCTSFTFNNVNGTCSLKNLNPLYIIRVKNDSMFTSGIMSMNLVTSSTTQQPCDLSPVPIGTCPSYYENDVDYKGLDLTYSFASSPQGCCGICLNTKGCNAFTYVNYFQICWLKNISSIIGARTCSKGRVSSLINPFMTSSTLPTTSTLRTNGSTFITPSTITTINPSPNPFTSSPTNPFVSSPTNPFTIPPINPSTSPSSVPPFSTPTFPTLSPNSPPTTTSFSTQSNTTTNQLGPPTCKPENGVRYIMTKIAESAFPDSGFCCQVCLATPICKAYSYNLVNQVCSLMKTRPIDTQKVNDTNATSGIIVP